MRQIVIPGERLAEGDVRVGYGAYKKPDGAYSSVYGIADVAKGFAKVIPLGGRYLPQVGDYVLGIVIDVRFGVAFVDINSPYDGVLPLERGVNVSVGDLIATRIVSVDEIRRTELEGSQRLVGGKLVDVVAVKVPRVVGKGGSMLRVLSSGGANIFVGRNGRILVKGTPAQIAKVEEAIRIIERESHTEGLTNRIEEFMGVPKSHVQGDSNGNEE
jgi:exosome complex component RRP4